MYNDPSGEFIFTALTAFFLGSKLLAAAVIGAAVGLAAYSVGVLVSNEKWNIGGALKATFFGALGGAASFGIGSLFQVGAVIEAAGELKFLVQAMAHGVSQGALSAMQGGGFLTGAASGFLGSLGASGWSSVMGTSGAAMIGFGALAGGVGAELSGGNFWQGALTGGIVAGLNHAIHSIMNGEDPKYYKKKPKYDKTNPLHEHYSDAMTLAEWTKTYENMSYNEIINESGKNSMGYGSGPKNRFVFNPIDGRVMDMTHVMEVGFRFGGENIFGIGNEIKQWFQGFAGLDPQKSAFNKQDFYSNMIGNKFYYYRLYETAYNINGNIYNNWVKNFNKYFTK